MTTRAQVLVQAQGTQGVPGIQWRGTHSTANTYTVRDVVRDEVRNRLYIAVQAVPANTALPSGDTNTAYWELFVFEREIPPGLDWQGDYVVGNTYKREDLVRDPNSNSLYVVIQDVPVGSFALTNTTYFNLILEAVPLTSAQFSTVETVAAGLANINTVSNASSAITTVANDLNNENSKIDNLNSNFAKITTVSNDLDLGASSDISTVSTSIANVNYLAGELADANSAINQADTEAAAAAASATAAAASAVASSDSAATAANHANTALNSSNTATTAAGTAGTSETSATNAKEDAEKLAVNPEDSQFTLSDGVTTGFSALHYKEKTQELSDGINARFLGAYTEAARPTSGLTAGAIIYNTTTSKLEVWNGAAWTVGLVGPTGPTGATGPGIVNIDFDSGTESLVVTYQDVGLVQQGAAGVGISSITQPQGTSSATFTLSDASTYSVNLPLVNAVDVAVNGSNQLELTFNNGTVLTSTGTIVGPTGAAGADGTDGAAIVDVEVHPTDDEQFRFELDTTPATYTSYINIPKVTPTAATINNNSQLSLTFSDGTVVTTVQSVRGPAGANGATGETGATGATGADGADGADGVSVSDVDVVTEQAGSATSIRFSKSDGSYTSAFNLQQGPPGPEGEPGAEGPQGVAGRGITSLELLAPANGLYNLVTRYTDDAANAPKTLVGQIAVPADGADGADGRGFTGGTYNESTGVIEFTSDNGLSFTTGDLRGTDGAAGADGTNGTNGTDGVSITGVTTVNSNTINFNLSNGSNTSNVTLPPATQTTSTFFQASITASALDAGRLPVNTGASKIFNGSWTTSASNEIVIPETGIYMIQGSLTFKSSEANDNVQFLLKSNNAPTTIQTLKGYAYAVDEYQTFSFSVIRLLQLNERIYLSKDTAATLTLANAGSETHLMLFKISTSYTES